MQVSIIIPVWNLWQFTYNCLDSLAKTTNNNDVEVIVVDNGSTDATVENLLGAGRKFFGNRFIHIRSNKNLGFAKGCNIGAENASGDILFFLNNDTIAHDNWLPPLLAAIDKPKVGAVGPLLLYPNGTVQHCGIYADPFKRAGHLYHKFPGDHPLIRKKRPLQAITGAAFMIPKSSFVNAGSFCEDYVNGWEDLDLCCRLRNSGYQLGVVPESVFDHHTSMTPGRFDKDQANARLFDQRWNQFVKPDLHILAKLDNCKVKISKNLLCWLELDEKQSSELNKMTISDAELIKITHEQPLWPAGWEYLMDNYLKKGETAQAIDTGLRGLDFSPNEKLRSGLNKLRTAMSDNQEKQYHILVDMYAKKLENPQVLIKCARAEARRANDVLLTSLFDEWSKNNAHM